MWDILVAQCKMTCFIQAILLALWNIKKKQVYWNNFVFDWFRSVTEHFGENSFPFTWMQQVPLFTRVWRYYGLHLLYNKGTLMCHPIKCEKYLTCICVSLQRYQNMIIAITVSLFNDQKCWSLKSLNVLLNKYLIIGRFIIHKRYSDIT